MGGSVSRADAAAPPLPVGMPPAAAPLLAQQAPKARSHNTLTHAHAPAGAALPLRRRLARAARRCRCLVLRAGGAVAAQRACVPSRHSVVCPAGRLTRRARAVARSRR
jgi:hypothetical protein